ncbi:SRPBCC family protein [Rathayibacter soli]|uniref:SRPBCC family protein n=1 Tax=Rathayibacter soli TaxID=3144168 RepID=UPI0027E4B97D|nr:SRPBCC family protein [Glaciibacter superstes]
MGNWNFSESITIARPPEEVYALVSDITRMGEWSPVCTGCWWDDDARGVGAWFTGHNETPERTWETRSQVAVDDPGREFAFNVGGDRTRWGYTFKQNAAGTQLTESWEVLPAGVRHFTERYGASAEAELRLRETSAHTGIHETLAALKKAAEVR